MLQQLRIDELEKAQNGTGVKSHAQRIIDQPRNNKDPDQQKIGKASLRAIELVGA